MQPSLLKPNTWSVRFLATDEDVCNTRIRDAWRERLQGSDNVKRIFQSPEWFDHLRITDPSAKTVLAVMERTPGAIEGIVPLRIANYPLPYSLAGWTLYRNRLRVASVLGSQPLLPEDSGAYEALFAAICQTFPECDGINFQSVRHDSFLWRQVHAMAANKELAVCCHLWGLTKQHLIQLPADFATYMKDLGAVTRQGLRRNLRKFEAQQGGAKSLVRVDAPEQVDFFVRSAAAISSQSWQHERVGVRFEDTSLQRRKLEDLAQRGMLRSYLLLHQEQPCAFFVGYQHGDVFHDAEVGYVRSHAQLSPGTVLLLKIIEDLMITCPPRFFDFGMGDASYKSTFSNLVFHDAPIMLLRPTTRNRVRASVYGMFTQARNRLNAAVAKSRASARS